MYNIEEIKDLIIEKLRPLNPEKVILFGSYAYGNPTEDSDIDLYVVTKDDFMPKTWREKSDLNIKVLMKIKDFTDKYPTDLITHTRAMHKKFIEMDSLFSKKIIQEGVVLLWN